MSISYLSGDKHAAGRRAGLAAMILVSALALLSACAATSGHQSVGDKGKKTGSIYYAGYSHKFQDTKKQICGKSCQTLLKQYRDEDKKIRAEAPDQLEYADKVGLLNLMERGSICLVMGQPDDTIRYLDSAQLVLGKRDDESHAKQGAVAVGSVAAELIGLGECGRYNPSGYEMVLLLNYKAMAYMLNGDADRAYNVARQSIELQNDEREKFRKTIEESKEVAAKQAAQMNDRTAGKSANQGNRSLAGSSPPTSYRAKVIAAQRTLQKAGYKLEVNGHLTSKTRAMLKDYQARKGLRPTGDIDDATMRAMGITGSPSQAAPPPMSYRDKVIATQRALQKAGYKMKVDGSLGPKTRAKLKDYQVRKGLRPTGDIDDATMRAMGITGSPSQTSSPPRSYRAKVIAAQRSLQKAGYKLAVNGHLTSKTRAMLKDYQARRGLRPTGDIDDATMRAMGIIGPAPRQAGGKDQQKYKNLFQVFAKEFGKYDQMCLAVPSAFVNPFGHYMDGMIQECKSQQKGEASLRGNARTSYEKGLQLDPNCPALRQAIAQLNDKSGNDKRLVYVVAMDGFVPERKVLSFYLPFGSLPVNVKVPMYVPVKSRVSRIEVQTASGQRLGNMLPLADVSALCLRYQKDALSTMFVGVVAAALVDLGEKKLAAGTFGKTWGTILGAALDTQQNPDTRSWMSLPSTIQAISFVPPKGADSLKIVSYGKDGKPLANRTVSIKNGDRHFILVRSMDDTMYAHASKNIGTTN